LELARGTGSPFRSPIDWIQIVSRITARHFDSAGTDGDFTCRGGVLEAAGIKALVVNGRHVE